ncbi:MAG: winged helix-turn-helix transcriptional regulator [Candidatus Thorarchaeota archaeon]
MDSIDKALLLKLLSNCRLSYRKLANEFGVTCPTIKRRVDQLIEIGIIESFTINLSQETRGVRWVYSEITTDLSENRVNLIREICDHKFTIETFAVGSKNYIVFAEVPYAEGVYEYGRFLRGLDGVTNVELNPARQFPTKHLANHSKYSTRGKKVVFTPQQLKVMSFLVNDARMSILDLAKKTGFKPKRVSRILKHLEECEGVHFTIKFNPCVKDCISFVLKLRFNEIEATPEDITIWLEEQFPFEYWMSFLLSSKPVIVNYMTSECLTRIESIIRKLKQAPFIRDVETLLIYHIEISEDENTLASSIHSTEGSPIEHVPVI